MEYDPLVEKAESIIAERKHDEEQSNGPKERRGRNIRVFLVLIPTIQYLVGLVQCTYYVHDKLYSVVAIGVGLFIIDAFAAILIKTRWIQELATCSAVGVAAGYFVGAVIYSYMMIIFFGYRDLRVFTNVMASEPPEQFADAGMIQFAHSTSVDDGRAVGFKSFKEGGNMYCLAPIVDSTMSLQDTVSFWAVGKDCCGSRSKFQCGDSHMPGVHSGVVVLRPEMFVAPGAMWMMKQHQALIASYMRAVELAENVFSIKVPENNATNVFIQWTKRPFAVQDSYKLKADWLVVVFSFIGVVIFTANAFLRKRAATESTAEIMV